MPQRSSSAERDEALPAPIAFLLHYGVDPLVLAIAAQEAEQLAVPPETALLSSGRVQEVFFYSNLADFLGLDFSVSQIRLAPGLRYPASIHLGFAALVREHGKSWLLAPRGALLAELMARRARGERFSSQFIITTPTHLSGLLRRAATAPILREASLSLAALDPSLSAKAGLSSAQCGVAMVAIAGTTFAFGLAPLPVFISLSLTMTGLFLASIWLRLFAGAASGVRTNEQDGPGVEGRWLPHYSIVVALHQESRVVPQLVQALNSLDYPRSKLDIKFVLEHDDAATRLAIEVLDLPAHFETIVAPNGWPRTKPRALNIALPLARGELLVIFDAEDVPGRSQLREAAERFLHAPADLACLQARLAIDNIEDSWLTRLFAIEYAALFDVLNPGLARLGLPVPLGGSSNHFRTSALRKVRGWDAWNVTEDADLGLRLARYGFHVDILQSSTREEAPARLHAWLTQRRRWSKGWLQTFITLTRDPPRLFAELGVLKSLATALLLSGLVIAPPLWPFFTVVLGYVLYRGVPTSDTTLSLLATALWISALFFGAASILWLALIGMKRRKLLHLWPSLSLLPIHYLLTSLAAWLALYDLFLSPYYWHKTEHGLAKTSRTADAGKDER
ncbi:MAG TPA: glycosyltransferase family 2 protein [Methylocella sp.]|nr:glycosyltransferase family 2 protein [Methylocella sp.]